ncbi:MAG: phosphomannomutase/phosphoglucomutase, partial [Promicromonosporaceae bacterium]|nr:phosphomannomutase/phosphoglucomutase [Promicromonosporaceae bacterium]
PISGSVITLLVGLRELARAKELNSDAQPVIVHNLITSRAVPELLAAHGAQPLRTRVGHSLIKAQMAESGAVFGGEHSGHFYYRDFWFADSGMLTALHVLAALGSNDGMPLSDMADWYQPYFQSGEINSKVKDQTAVRDAIVEIYRKAYPHAEIDSFDGVTFSNWEHRPRWWFNLRGSNTEPYLRLNVEAEDEDIMEKVRDDVLALITRYAD